MKKDLVVLALVLGSVSAHAACDMNGLEAKKASALAQSAALTEQANQLFDEAPLRTSVQQEVQALRNSAALWDLAALNFQMNISNCLIYGNP